MPFRPGTRMRIPFGSYADEHSEIGARKLRSARSIAGVGGNSSFTMPAESGAEMVGCVETCAVMVEAWQTRMAGRRVIQRRLRTKLGTKGLILTFGHQKNPCSFVPLRGRKQHVEDAFATLPEPMMENDLNHEWARMNTNRGIPPVRCGPDGTASDSGFNYTNGIESARAFA